MMATQLIACKASVTKSTCNRIWDDLSFTTYHYSRIYIKTSDEWKIISRYNIACTRPEKRGVYHFKRRRMLRCCFIETEMEAALWQESRHAHHNKSAYSTERKSKNDQASSLLAMSSRMTAINDGRDNASITSERELMRRLCHYSIIPLSWKRLMVSKRIRSRHFDMP